MKVMIFCDTKVCIDQGGGNPWIGEKTPWLPNNHLKEIETHHLQLGIFNIKNDQAMNLSLVSANDLLVRKKKTSRC